MPRYVIVIREPEGAGCGYTIGCGLQVHDVEAPTPKEALRIAIEENWFGCDPAEEYSEDPLSGDFVISSVKIYEANLVDDGDLFEEYHRRLVERLKNREDASTEEEERKELERLKRKYESVDN